MPLIAAASIFLFTPSAFERTFDENISHYPLAASIAGRDPHLRDIFLHQTEQAFNGGGWRAANGALKASLASEVAIYADDEHINAISRAELALLLKLESHPAACKTYLLAGAEGDETREAAPEFATLEQAYRAAIENGFKRRSGGIKWTRPSNGEISNIEERLGQGPAAKLTQDEFGAEARYLDGQAELVCSASIKKRKNLLAMDSPDAAEAQRIRMATTGRIDMAHVLKKLCPKEKAGVACS